MKSAPRAASHMDVDPGERDARGSVIVLPDFGGSQLVSSAPPESGQRGVTLWPSVKSLSKGELVTSLALHPNGESRPLHAESHLFLYEPLHRRLQLRSRVIPFLCDWRRSVEEQADDLATLLDREGLFGTPTDVVAHGMGGLVALWFIHEHPEKWRAMATSSERGGGRLVLLGTPLRGCYDAAAVLAGTSLLPRWVNAIDLKNGLNEIILALRSFPVLYELMPAPGPDAGTQRLYSEQGWHGTISAEHLAAAVKLHQELARAAPLDPGRVACIVGTGTPTRTSVEVHDGGSLRFGITLAGDGVVPLASAVLDGAPAYEARCSHAGLLGNEDVLAAITEILERGEARRLPRLARVAAEGPIPSVFLSSLRAQRVDAKLERLAKDVLAPRSRGAPPSDDAMDHSILHRHMIEEALLLGMFGESKEAVDLLESATSARRAPGAAFRLHVQAVHGDILADSAAPVIVIGHYKDTSPTGSEAVVDERLGHWISDTIAQGVVGSELGETFYVPVAIEGVSAEAVLLVSKGPAGQMGLDDLKCVAARAAYTLLSMGKNRMATVVMGTGRDELPYEPALSALLEGLREGIVRFRRARVDGRSGADQSSGAGAIAHEAAGLSRHATEMTVRIVENNRAYYDRLVGALGRRAPERAERAAGTVRDAGMGDTHYLPADDRIGAGPGKDERSGESTRTYGIGDVRLTVEELSTGASDLLRFSAMTRTASIPERDVDVAPRMVEELATRVTSAMDRDDAAHFGRVLGTYLLPPDFHDALVDARPLTLVLNHSAAAIPWEMLVIDGSSGPLTFGIDIGVTRQLCTHLSPAPRAPRPNGQHLKFLVIADPAPERPLPKAREEGLAIVELLRDKKRRGLIEVIACIGPDECDPADLLALLLEEDFDVVHFTGHGRFDPAYPDRSGWILRDGATLSVRDMFKAHHAPRLVFANACSSAVMKSLDPAAGSHEVASLAEVFFCRGVENYIGAGWRVDDAAAAVFATSFYRVALKGEPLGEAMEMARARCREASADTTWGAFQHYGWYPSVLTTPVATEGGGRRA